MSFTNLVSALLCTCRTVSAMALIAGGSAVFGEDLIPGKTIELSFPDAGLPPTLYTMMNGTVAAPCLTVRLPDDYDAAKTYPLLVYVPGYDGGPRGNIYNAEAIAGPRGWVVATLPLFKKSVDQDETNNGLIVSLEDYPVVARAYDLMLGRLYAQIPNLDPSRSTMVGFSNGAITLGVLISCHDEFILTHFKNFCLVNHGMFHLTDLHKKYARDCRYLILVGDKEGFGREVKIRQSQLQQDAWKLLNINVSCQIMKDTGHEFNEPQMALVREWMQTETTKPADVPGGAVPGKP